jgi:hypothetical protein
MARPTPNRVSIVPVKLKPQEHDGKAGEDAVAFCDEDTAFRNLFERQRDRVWVRGARPGRRDCRARHATAAIRASLDRPTVPAGWKHLAPLSHFLLALASPRRPRILETNVDWCQAMPVRRVSVTGTTTPTFRNRQR